MDAKSFTKCKSASFTRNLPLLDFTIWSILLFKILWELFRSICHTFDMQVVYVLSGDDHDMKLPYFTAIGAFICAIFARGLPYLSAVGIWVGFATFLSLIYILTTVVLSLIDGKISNWMLGLGTTSYCMVSMMICTLKDKEKSKISKLQFTSFYGDLKSTKFVKLLIFLSGSRTFYINLSSKLESKNKIPRFCCFMSCFLPVLHLISNQHKN